MPVFLLEHFEGCMPVRPCPSCIVAEFLRSRLWRIEFETVIKIVTEEKNQSAGIMLSSAVIDFLESIKRSKFNAAELSELKSIVDYLRTKSNPMALAEPISSLGPMSTRLENALRGANLLTIKDLVAITEAEYLRIPNFGHKCQGELRSLLARAGHQTTRLDWQY